MIIFKILTWKTISIFFTMCYFLWLFLFSYSLSDLPPWVICNFNCNLIFWVTVFLWDSCMFWTVQICFKQFHFYYHWAYRGLNVSEATFILLYWFSLFILFVQYELLCFLCVWHWLGVLIPCWWFFLNNTFKKANFLTKSLG